MCGARVKAPDGVGVRAESVEGASISGRSWNWGVQVQGRLGAGELCLRRDWLLQVGSQVAGRVPLCSSECPRTLSVDQARLELRDPPASFSQLLGFRSSHPEWLVFVFVF